MTPDKTAIAANKARKKFSPQTKNDNGGENSRKGSIEINLNRSGLKNRISLEQIMAGKKTPALEGANDGEKQPPPSRYQSGKISNLGDEIDKMSMMIASDCVNHHCVERP